MRPIPAGRRNKKKFKHAGDMLAWALERFHYRRKQGLKVSTKDPAAANKFIAMATLTRVAASHAQAILAMSRRSAAESGYVNVRAMLEVWGDFRIIANDKSGDAAARAYLAGAFALLRKHPTATIEADLKKKFGTTFEAAKKQFKKSPTGHWTGKGRKAVVAEQCGKVHGDYYELLSWDGHPVVQIALDMQALDAKAGKYQLGHRTPQHEVATQNCAMATHILRDMWNELIKHEPK